MKLTSLLPLVDKLQQAGKTDNLQYACNVFCFVYGRKRWLKADLLCNILKIPDNLVSFFHKYFKLVQIRFGFLLQHFQFVFFPSFAQDVIVKEN